MSVEWIGPYGRLLPVRAPQPEPFEAARPASHLTLLSGAVAGGQRAPRSSRRWTWTIPWGDEVDLAPLIGLEQGVFGPPPWRWYDPMAAATNMLPPDAAAGRLDAWLGGSTADPVTIDGMVVPALSGSHEGPTRLSTGPLPVTVVDPAPVLPGRVYTASGWAAGLGGQVSLRFRDADGAVTREVGSDTGPAGWRHVSAVAQPGEAGVTWRWDGLTGPPPACAGWRLHEGPPPTRGIWQPGMGIPRVTIAGMQGVYQLAARRRDGQALTRRDVTVELVEVA